MKDIISVHDYRYHSAYYEIFVHEAQSGEWKWAVNIVDRKTNGLLWRHIGVEPTEAEARLASQSTVKERMTKYAPAAKEMAAIAKAQYDYEKFQAEDIAAVRIYTAPKFE